VRGRSFDTSRRFDKANEAVTNVSLGWQYFSNEDPIGKHLDYGDWIWEIIGIVGDTRYLLPNDPEPIQSYPLYARMLGNPMLAVRSRGDAQQQVLPVQRIVRQLDSDLPVSDVLTMDQLLNKNTVDANFNAKLLFGFTVISLVLAAAGIFGVPSYMVAQRTNELGIRVALGAQRSRVLANVLADGMRPALLGLAGGHVVSLATVRLIRSLFFETRRLDPAVFVLVSIGLIAAAAASCIALRGARRRSILCKCCELSRLINLSSARTPHRQFPHCKAASRLLFKRLASPLSQQSKSELRHSSLHPTDQAIIQ
jgi:putative ABC transport system permease protein